MDGVSYLSEALLTALVLLLALYGAIFDPPENRAMRWVAGTVSGLAATWLVIVLIVASDVHK